MAGGRACQVSLQHLSMADYLIKLLLDQFEASLEMLGECVDNCPEEHWESRIGNAAFWRVVYHTLFFVDLYLSADEASFAPREFHRDDAVALDGGDSGSEASQSEDVPFSKEQITEYIEHCRVKARDTISAETQASLENRSGFPWYPMSRGEHHLASIRHIQHHVGQLSASLIRNTGKGVRWIGKLS